MRLLPKMRLSYKICVASLLFVFISVALVALTAILSAFSFSERSERSARAFAQEFRVLERMDGKTLESLLNERGPLHRIRRQALFLGQDLKQRIKQAEITIRNNLYVVLDDGRSMFFSLDCDTISTYEGRHNCNNDIQGIGTIEEARGAAQRALFELGIERDISSTTPTLSQCVSGGGRCWSLGYTPVFCGISAVRTEISLTLCARCGAIEEMTYWPFSTPCEERAKLMDAEHAEQRVLKVCKQWLYAATPRITSCKLQLWDGPAENKVRRSEVCDSHYCFVLSVVFEMRKAKVREGTFVIDAENGDVLKPCVPSKVASIGRILLETFGVTIYWSGP